MIRILTFLIVLFPFLSVGQQIPQYSQFTRNQYIINPAAAGSDDYMKIALAGRMQWVGVEGAPNTSYLYFTAPVNKMRLASMKRTFGRVRRNRRSVKPPSMKVFKMNHAFGAQLLIDQYGPFRTLKLAGTYAVHFPINRDYSFSFGANLGLSSRSFISEKAQVLSNLTDLGYSDNTYNAYSSNRSAQYTMDLDAGLYFYGKGLFAGFSVSQLTKDLVKFGNKTTNFDPRMHFYLSAGYKIQVTNRMTLTPALLFKYMKPAPISMELNVQAEFREVFWLGLSYRHKDAVVAMIGANLWEKFSIGYSVDISVSKFNQVSSGGHELVLSLALGKPASSMVKY
ncbi:MAG: type IX secretion system membrane protein PorP/SprF [Crocinitomicaceae bacterium]|nr:type IX secretion system membrane protein PorP/SprF [Crocinitomicaceae bacterium]